MFDDKELLHKETEELFLANDKLREKLLHLQGVIRAVRDTIKNHGEVHVSFAVYEALNMLAETDVKDFRVLECLKLQRTSFNPSFDDLS